MNRINKTTLREKHATPKAADARKQAPSYLTVKKAGYSLSLGLFTRLGSPRWIEFFQDGNKLYIGPSDEENGFKVTFDPMYATTAQFRNRYLAEIFGKYSGRIPVATEPITATRDKVNVIALFEIIFPKK